jgi:hypothetical protein
MENRRKYYADSSRRVQKWRQRQGKMLTTYIADSRLLEALHNEARVRNKAVWKVLAAAVEHGLPVARARAWWRNYR